MNPLDFLKTPAARVPRPVAGETTIRDLADPDEVTIPLEYPQGLVLPPVVQAGDVVARNQVIGRSDGGNCVHASIGGRVREIRRVWTAGGDEVPAVVIERGEVPGLTPSETLARCGLETASATRVQLLRAGGVISPWTTPGRDQAEDGRDPEIRHLVILGHDQETTQHVQELLLQEQASEVADGLRLLRDVAAQAQITLTVPRRLVERARQICGDGLTVVGVPDEYRRRLERVLVARLTGITVPNHVPYRSCGIAVMGVETALAARNALRGHPFVHKTLTVSGRPVTAATTVRVPLGMSVRAVLAACGVDPAEAGRVLAGGPMGGVALYTVDTPVDKFLQGIHVLMDDEVPDEIHRTCVNCGRCVRACPVHLQVNLIGRCVEFDRTDDTVSFHPEACLECGLCAFVCPAGRPLVQMVRMANRYARRSA